MGMAEPLEPESNDDVAAGAPPVRERADWLVGAEDGVEAELQRNEQTEATPRLVPKLFRPGDAVSSAPSAVKPPAPRAVLSRPMGEFEPTGLVPTSSALPTAAEKPRVVGAVTPKTEDTGFVQGHALSWEPGANSVPSIRREPARSMMPPEPTRDFPMDDAEERGSANARAAMLAAAAAEAVARPHDVVEPEAFNVPAPPLPWWMQAPEAFRTDRRLQVLAVLGLLLLVGISLIPRGEPGVSLGDLRKRPDHFNGQDVKVSGKIGEVFQVGGGYAFYLHQGRDTMVVFTRTRTPKSRESVNLVGHVSTGYLDGQPRLALFENNTPAK